MQKYLALVTVVMLAVPSLISCGTPSYKAPITIGEPAAPTLQLSYDTPLSLGSLPASGYVDLEPLNSVELDRLGLGGSSPLREPPYSPFNKYGMFWSEPFSVGQGDTIQVTIYSDTPVSWFGVDWSNLDIRGTLATTEEDEDGRSFDPQYPAHSSVDARLNSYRITLSYKIRDDTDCVLVVKNANPDRSWRVSMAIASKSAITSN